jgi:hypothetical protein
LERLTRCSTIIPKGVAAQPQLVGDEGLRL